MTAEAALAAGLAAGRIAIGVAIWVAPQRALSALGFDRAADRPDALTLARIAATRDLVLGVWQGASLRDRGSLRRATIAGAVSDAGDALAFAILPRAGGKPEPAAKGLAAAVPAALAGAWIARAQRSERGGRG